MGLGAVSGGLLIAFMLIILLVILAVIVIVRFNHPDVWEGSTAALYYRQVFRTVILITIAAIAALTVALPRWSRNSPPFSDSFVGMGMFETCACSDPAAICGEPSGFRAVQGFSVLGLLSLTGLAFVTAVGGSMDIEDNAQANLDGGIGISTGTGGAATMASSSPAAGPPAPSPGGPPPGATPRNATDITPPPPIVPGVNDTGSQSGQVDGDESAGPSKPMTLPNKIALVLLIFANLCTFFSWVVFAGQSLNKACDGSTALGAAFDGGSIGWGWVFRFFEWLILLVALVLFLLSSCGVLKSFQLTASRMHILSLLLLGMSCLSTTTSTWSFSNVDIVLLNNTSPGGVQTVGAFFACSCANTLCVETEEVRAAAIAFYLLFFFFFVPRAFYALVQTAVWQEALRSVYTTCDGCCNKITALQNKLGIKMRRVLCGVFALFSPLFLLVATGIAAGVLAEEKCGATDMSADIGLVFSCIAVFFCWVEGFVAFLDGLMPVNISQEELDEEEAKKAAADAEEAAEASAAAEGGEQDGGDGSNAGVAMDNKFAPGPRPQAASPNGSGQQPEFSDAIMRPPVATDSPRSNQSAGGVSPSRMSPADAGDVSRPPPQQQQQQLPPPPPPPKVQAVTRISSD